MNRVAKRRNQYAIWRREKLEKSSKNLKNAKERIGVFEKNRIDKSSEKKPIVTN